MNKKIKLVLSGSGTLYPIHVGAVIALLENGFEITEICGVSGGAIVAGALASGYDTPIALQRLFSNMLPELDFSLFAFLKFGIIKGDAIKKQFSNIFSNCPKLKNSKIPIHIVCSNLSKRRKEVFSTINNPNENMAEIIRMSMSFPGVFEYVEKNGDIYVDGGVYSNFPLEVLGDSKDIIGIEISTATIKPIANIFDYISALGDSLVTKTEEEEKIDQKQVSVLQIKTDLANMDLKINKNYIKELIEFGRAEADKQLKMWKDIPINRG